MSKFVDCQGVPRPVFTIGTVVSCSALETAKPANSVYSLKIEISKNTSRFPVAGQFFMLRSKKSQHFLARPISFFNSEKTPRGILLDFLILVKGKGTKELCALKTEDEIELLGPLGNTFPKPSASEKVCIVGGGIGIAPVAAFAKTLPENSYDFFACFKSGSYGLENLKAASLTITTDDGSVGTKGILPIALDEEKLQKGGYSALYACGPLPMLAYIKKITEAAGIPCWISMESRMACGVGVCLGCVIPTTRGNVRCCKDGPIFDSKILSFETQKTPQHSCKNAQNEKPDMSFEIKGVRFENPVIASSGTFGFGIEYDSVFDVNRLGGISSKGLTIEKREGNSGIRLWETPSGLMNSIGLQNPGIPHFIENELPEMIKLKPVAIANLSGSSLETYLEGAKLLEKSAAPVIELNISCPNVELGGASFGMSCNAASSVVKAVRAEITKPLIVKLTPQSHELNEVALQCIADGADAISLCNSFQGVAIDIESGKPVLDKIKAGLGGPAVRPIAVRLIYELYEAIQTLPETNRVPIIAIGGIAEWQDVVEFIMAGASAVQIGSATFSNPRAMIECIDGLEAFMQRKGYKTLEELKGIAHTSSC
ncbi:MAG: dihydroorotate dehydrogenase [Treponemataceae bacterium]|nr:dihydroorotate dehydrogenase [Treponemataceae bacterium]